MTALFEPLCAEYHIFWKILNTIDFGVPHHRERWYCVLIHKSGVHATSCAFTWPTPVRPLPKLSKFITPVASAEFQGGPDASRKQEARNVQAHIEKHLKNGVANPFSTCICIDMCSSDGFAHSRVEASPTLTKTRCEQLGYWVTSKGARMSVGEITSLQG